MNMDSLYQRLSVAVKPLLIFFAAIAVTACASNAVPITEESEQAADVTLPVRPDGKITTRLAEDIAASGKTPTELAREIEGVYQEFVKQPTVTVSVSSFVGSPEQHIKVVGGGAKPKIVQYKNGMTLLDLMVEVGGLDKFASGNKSKLVRRAEGKESHHS